MRVGVDGTPLFRRVDGIGRYTADLLAATARARPDWELRVLGFADDAARPSLVPDLPNVSTVLLPGPRRLHQAAFSYGVRIPVGRLVGPLDVLWHPNYALFPHVTGVPRAVVVYDLTYVDLPEVVETRNLGHLRRTVPRAVREADAVLAISPFTAERIAATFPRSAPVNVVDCGLSPRFLDAPRGRRPAGLEPGYVLCVGTLEPRKNLLTLLRAWAGVPAEVRRSHPLVVVGKAGWGPADVPADLAAVAAEVRFTGYVEDDDLPAVYRSASLFVFPSRYEGFGLPLLEAMASGVPAVVSDIPPFRQIGGDLVDYADPDDPGELRGVILAALARDGDARTAAAIDAARAWTWDRGAEQLARVLERIARSRQGPLADGR